VFSHTFRKKLLQAGILLNTLMIPVNFYYEQPKQAYFNILCGSFCWVAYLFSEWVQEKQAELDEQKEKWKALAGNDEKPKEEEE
jgi:hypothetical protein